MQYNKPIKAMSWQKWLRVACDGDAPTWIRELAAQHIGGYLETLILGRKEEFSNAARNHLEEI